MKSFSIAFALTLCASAALAEDALTILPPQATLHGEAASQRLLLQRQSGEEIGAQVREGITWSTSNPAVATVTNEGVVHPVANGNTDIVAKTPNGSVTAEVTVVGMNSSEAWGFRHAVLPVLSKAGCNSGACHGALAGKGGFRLSLRGYDPMSDYFNIAKQDRGRRIELADPGRSLLIAKPSGALPHKGGLRFETDSREYQILSEWIAAGASPPTKADTEVERIEVLPGRSIHTVGSKQDLVVIAHFSDGRAVDVSEWVIWSSSDEAVCSVDEHGTVTVIGPGEGAIVAWYSSKLAIARVTVPFEAVASAGDVVDTREPVNFIDEHVNRQLERLNLVASGPCSDASFIRRAYVDTIGLLPTSEEVRTFLADDSVDKREQLIDELLERPEFVDYWTYQWSDIFLMNGTLLRPKALEAYYGWLRGHVAQNTAWDDLVREVLTATGSSYENGATNFYALHQSPEDMTENASQAFMGLSIGCAKCHNHPLEKWTNDQYYAMANLFARVKAKGWGGEPRNGDGLRTLYVSESGDLVQPRTGNPQPPAPLDAEPLAIDDTSDRRSHLAAWLVSPENPYFSRSIANRVWAKFFGVGIVEKVDDMRVSNPASNDELLNAAAGYLVEQDFDLKSLMRAILSSNAYQRSSEPLAGNKNDKRFYSRYYPKRMTAEVLHDAIVRVTEVPTKFDKIVFPGNNRQDVDIYKNGTRAIQLHDSAVENYFLNTFGRNERRIVCECERSDEPSMVQVLHLSNGNTINDKLANKQSCVGDFVKLRSDGMSDGALLDEIYLNALARFPTERERTQLQDILPAAGADDERIVLEDILWAVLTSREFIFNH
ncbi:DUF1553 domain-containing protein [Stratiformator vulcanicus]|uniref:Bacterial Ig-like domain (Group 2) n=1 Tax=Stratiformator vulcanicus TaxID=2527980 RepID=A0A517QVR8_9PLAN|nr:DUF1553 domain-containing protein [Stratiformator vulcanicus]QDT35708.1 Bacterial Ig-like domain (group 2) [Stratiformator vulcanicus]